MLSEHPEIKNVAVNAWSDVSGDKKLVAYYTSINGTSIEVTNLRSYLTNKLPDYMVPSFFVKMGELPVTPNKKIDRKALPAPDISEVSAKEEYAPPRDDLDKELVSIWQKILGIKVIGINDNFFDLGGHSLLVVQLFAQIEKKIGANLPLAILFQAPTIAQLADRIKNKNWENKPRTNIPIEKIDRPKYLPLSFPQQRLWFLEKYEANTPVYNIPMAYRIYGEFDIDAFGKAMNEIIRRHEILRTSFKINKGTPYQDILSKLKLSIPLIDLSGLPSQDREAVLSKQLHSKAGNTFNISEGPLLSCDVFKLGQLEYVVLFVIHHLIFDGWSTNVLLKELNQQYLFHHQGGTESSKELPIQYADFSLWQHQWINEDFLKQQLYYWKNQLKGELPSLELPTDFPRPAVQKYNGKIELFKIDLELAEMLTALGRKENSTLFMVLLTALYVLVYRYSGQKDICVGTVVANRIRPELDDLMGVFVNNLVMRANFSSNQSFRELLRTVRQICLEAYENQDLPFEKLVEELQPKRDISRTPLFQLLFSYQEINENKSLPNGIKLEQVPVHSGVARTDLSLWIDKNDYEINGALEYCTHLFQAETINRFVGNYKYLLKKICENADQKVSEITILNGEEKNKVLYEWNNTKAFSPTNTTLIQLFEEQVKSSGNKVVVESEGEKLSYIQLNERVNQTANYLLSIGVKEEDYVGICLDRSVEMLISMLAVLKCGAAYLPMDPIFPPERLDYMLDDAKVKVIITNSKLINIFSGFKGKSVFIDEEFEKIKRCDNINPDIKINPDNLAYVIYTSGSTGNPKGVQIKHSSVVNFLLAMKTKPGINPEDVLVSVTTISFDISVPELFLPIITGAKLIIASKAITLDGKLLLKLLEEKNATIMQATPSTWKMMIESGWKRTPGLKILCGGEAPVLDLAKPDVSQR